MTWEVSPVDTPRWPRTKLALYSNCSTGPFDGRWSCRAKGSGFVDGVPWEGLDTKGIHSWIMIWLVLWNV